MKTIVRLFVVAAALLVVGSAFSSCKKDSKDDPKKEETKPVPCFVYADKTNTPMPDELQVTLSQQYAVRFVPSDGTKLLPYDKDHQIKFSFDGTSSGKDMFVWAGMSAADYGITGWCFGFGGKTSSSPKAKVGDTDMVTIVYDHEGVTIMKRVKLIAVE